MKLPTAFLCALLGCVLACAGGANGESASGVPAGFADMCSEAGVECHVASTPPDLVGVYTGTGETIATTSEAWSLGTTADVVLEVSRQDQAGTIEGLIDIRSTTLEILDAVILGSDRTFSIYGRLPFGGEQCQSLTKGILTGTASELVAPAQVTGTLVLEFADVSGPECTPEALAEEGKGASFSYTVERADGPIARWSECFTESETTSEETCDSYCASSGGMCSLDCDGSGPLKTANDCDSSLWAIGPEDCNAGIWQSRNAIARCCCE